MFHFHVTLICTSRKAISFAFNSCKSIYMYNKELLIARFFFHYFIIRTINSNYYILCLHCTEGMFSLSSPTFLEGFIHEYSEQRLVKISEPYQISQISVLLNSFKLVMAFNHFKLSNVDVFCILDSSDSLSFFVSSKSTVIKRTSEKKSQ